MTTMDTLREQLPTTGDLLHAVGLQYERTLSSTLAAISLFAIGAGDGSSPGAAARAELRRGIAPRGQGPAAELESGRRASSSASRPPTASTPHAPEHLPGDRG